MCFREKLKCTLLQVVMMLITQSAYAQIDWWNYIPDIVTDPKKYGEMVLDTKESVEQAANLFTRLTNVKTELSAFKKIADNVYGSAVQMQRTVDLTRQIYDNSNYIINRFGYNIQQYAALADAGWLTTTELNNALITSTALAKYTMEQIGGFMDLTKTFKSWKPGGFLKSMEQINRALALAASGTDALFKEMQRRAEMRQIQAKANATRKYILGQYSKPLSMNGNKKNDLGAYERLVLEEMERQKAINQTVPGNRVPEDNAAADMNTGKKKKGKSIAAAVAEGTAGVADSINKQKNTVYNFVAGIIFIIVMIAAGVAAVDAYQKGRADRLVRVIIGMLVAIILLGAYSVI